MRRNSLFDSAFIRPYISSLRSHQFKKITQKTLSADKVFFIMFFSVICFGIAVDAAVDSFLFIGEAENVREFLLG